MSLWTILHADVTIWRNFTVPKCNNIALSNDMRNVDYLIVLCNVRGTLADERLCGCVILSSCVLLCDFSQRNTSRISVTAQHVDSKWIIFRGTQSFSIQPCMFLSARYTVLHWLLTANCTVSVLLSLTRLPVFTVMFQVLHEWWYQQGWRWDGWAMQVSFYLLVTRPYL